MDREQKGFTMIEMLLVVAVISILALVVFFLLNPGQLLKQGNDGSRVQDILTLDKAISLYYEDAINNPNALFMGTSSVVYLSLPDPTATTTAGTNCSSLGFTSTASTTYHCAASSTYLKVDGTGWVPINFNSFSAGNVISALPKDPINTATSGEYLVYTTDGVGGYEVMASPQSTKYIPASSTADFLRGTNLALITIFPIPRGSSSSTPTISSFSASPTAIASPGTSTLSWTVTNASSVAITPGALSTSTLTGSITVNPVSSTTYTLTATNAYGTSTLTTSVVVDNTAPTTPTGLSATSPSSTQINLSWTASTDSGGSGLAGYNIFRCTGSCTPSTKVATSSGTSYSDTGLTASTTYTYAVSAFDGVGNTSATSTNASGTTQTSGGSSYLHYRTITVTSSVTIASGTQTNFPMLITGVGTAGAASSSGGLMQNICTAANGGQEPCDLVFATSSSNCGVSNLNFETESYNSSTGALFDWVNVPSLSAGTVIYACYDNASITTDQSHPSGTWNNYAGIWHLPNGTSLTANDSTANSNNGKLVGTPTAVAGMIDGAAHFNGSSQYITATSSASLQLTGSWSVSAWVKLDTIPSTGYYGIVSRNSGSEMANYGIDYNVNATGNPGWQTWFDGNSNFESCSSLTPSVATGTWFYVTATWSTAGGMQIYVNGAQKSSCNTSGDTPINGSGGQLTIGNDNGSDFWPGTVDEARVTNSALSPSWILTEYNNQNSPSTFYTVGAQN